MATLPTHALVGWAVARFWPGEEKRWPLYAGAAACAVLPDIDAIGFWMGVPYESLCGHRGLTHGMPFAAATGIACALAARSKRAALPLALATATHGVLDAITDGGLGVAFFSPFSNARYFLPWRPIEVAPISITDFIEQGGLGSLRGELIWIWAPLLLLVLVTSTIRASRTES